jgi:Cu+-exporting ATPase
MTCSSCVNTVESGLRDLPGVRSASVVLLPAGKAVVTFQPSAKLDAAAVGAHIEALGYGARLLNVEPLRPAPISSSSGSSARSARGSRLALPGLGTASTNSAAAAGPPLRRATIKVGGMTCAACVGTVESALRRLAGVKNVQVRSVRCMLNIYS